MHLCRLGLTHYRCYRQLDLALPAGSVVLWGGNAAGKSSLLEALFVLATTKSPYAASDRQWLSWEALTGEAPFSRIVGEVVRSDGRHVIEVILARLVVDGEERFTKRLRIDQTPRRALDAIGCLQVVLFTPRDLRIVDGSPSDRRRYLDILLCQVDHAYCHALSQYNRVLVQRNHLLRRLSGRGGDVAELAFWEGQLAQHGGRLMAVRATTVAALQRIAGAVHRRLAGVTEELGIAYRSALDASAALASVAPDGAVVPSPDDIAAAADCLAAQLVSRRGEDMRRGMTLVGPHRDDIVLTVNGTDLRAYGSRGQQRTAALALKIAEAQLMTLRAGESPVLLLDDVLSELDEDRRRRLLDCLEPAQQTLLTTTDLSSLPHAFLDRSLALSVVAGSVMVPRTPPGE